MPDFSRTYLAIILIIASVSSTKAQHDTVYDGCINVREIHIPFEQSTFLTSDTFYHDVRFNDAFYLDVDEYTFWYKLIADADCYVTFRVMGTNVEDVYDFMLYRFSKTNFCQAVVDQLVLPVNNNSYQMVAPSSGDKKIQSAYQEKFLIRKGDVYYIAVLHISGQDCGHLLFIKACGQLLAMSAVKKSCFVLAQPTVAELPPLENVIKTRDTLTVITQLDISGKTIDNDNGHPIDAKISLTDIVSGKKINLICDDSSGYSTTVERNRRFNYTCSALGYKTINGEISFSTKSSYDFFLNKIPTGESFVMDNIYFYPNTYAFRSGSDKQLNELLRYLQLHPEVTIEIQGHTAGDNKVKMPTDARKGAAWAYTGSAKKLSRLRAEAVKDYLISGNINRSRLKTVGFGADKPVISRPRSQEERMKNMRVEIMITSSLPEPKDYQKIKPSFK